ncbi:DUF6454 family protein [Runella slithyformis]|uniref:Uncharacterized protein n=1 Tax=Runella slithyformis (strain ATCC 29530 / DSM 19594 / LMG 11500 / NCIMB 11436 / LSU 4) TaxID=761193 RepID=A0A7U3ZPU8_RUNSL|nr:DUF6454 family protein [Runella slithyformis]AEI51151.1 hypothetical protein Runsl_4839 [Runella slithyformis DSM 19594]
MKYLVLIICLLYQIGAQSQLLDRLTRLRPDTPWKQVAAVRLQFPAFHPQGMVKIGDFFYMSSVEVTRKRQNNDGGEGIGHLFKFDSTGKLLAEITLGEGLLYHPGGIDFDGEFIWVPVAEYRPDSRSILYRVAPKTLKATEVMRFNDHIGGLVHDTDAHVLKGISWGGRRFYQWELNARSDITNAFVSPEKLRITNPSFYIDYQDCHYIGQHKMLCAGLKKYKKAPDGPEFALGGLEVVDMKDNRPVFQVPLLLWSPTGAPMTNNPFWMESTATGLRGYFVPDDDAASTLYVYEAAVK